MESPTVRRWGFYFRNVTELVLFGVARIHAHFGSGPQPSQLVQDEEGRALQKAGSACTTSSRLAAPARIWNYSLGGGGEGWTQRGDELDTYSHTRPLHKGYNGHSLGLAKTRRTLGMSSR